MWRDWALVVVLVPLAVLEGVLRPDLPWRVFSVVVTAGLTPALLWRRTRPLEALAVCFVTTSLVPIALDGGTLDMYSLAYLLILPYALLRWGSGREIVIGLAVMLTGAGLSVLVEHAAPANAIGPFAVVLSTTTLGWAFRYRARARTRELDQVKLLEREQLARELHDTVAHHVSAMAIRAQAGLATAASRPDAATEALRVIEAEAARALDEMRAMVRVLRRDEPADLTPGGRSPTWRGSRPPAGRTTRPSGSSSPVTSAASPRRSRLRSTASPRRRSRTRCGTPATPPGWRCTSPGTAPRCACG